jgi:hypothetical protein
MCFRILTFQLALRVVSTVWYFIIFFFLFATKNMHLRYYFNYVDDHCYILLMIECFIENIWWHSCTVVTIIECWACLQTWVNGTTMSAAKHIIMTFNNCYYCTRMSPNIFDKTFDHQQNITMIIGIQHWIIPQIFCNAYFILKHYTIKHSIYL